VQQGTKTWMTITWHAGRQRYEVRFHANEEQLRRVVEDLKRIDLEHRSHNSASRVWSIAREGLEEVLAVAARHFDEATLVEGSRYRNLVTGQIAEQLVLF